MDALDKRVVDELEEVGARYFTVKIQSKTHPGTLVRATYAVYHVAWTHADPYACFSFKLHYTLTHS